MARNIEIKARLEDFDQQLAIARELSGGDGETIQQRDVFFNSPKGRLKLRFFSVDRGELIYYERADKNGPKTSNYFISRSDNPEQLCEVLTGSLGQKATVTKTRMLFLVGRTRIHLDQVTDLGDFLELEVVLADGDNIDDGQVEAESLMKQLQIPADALIDRAYVDLLIESSSMQIS